MARFFLIGVDQGKAQIMAGLAMPERGPGKVHNRVGFEDSAAHFWQWATAEHLVITDTAGGTKKEWKARKGQQRNEVLDCLVLALAVAHSADFGIGARLQRMAETGGFRRPEINLKELAGKMAAITHPQTAAR